MVRVAIDGTAVDVPEGATIMEAAGLAGVRIPRLCAHPALRGSSRCGVCVVSVAGREGLAAACAETVSEGMRVWTDTYEARRARAAAIELMMLAHPNECSACFRGGDCELARLFFDHAPDAARDDLSRPEEPPVMLGPRLMHRPSRCLGCGRCVRFDESLPGGPRIRLSFREWRPCVERLPMRSMDSAYSLCAVELCPAGALEPRGPSLGRPGWMVRRSETLCTGCSSLCGARLVHDGRYPLGLEPETESAAASPWMCDHGRRDFTPSPLARPLLLEGLAYRGASWEEALERLARTVGERPASGVVAVISARAGIEECLSFVRLARMIDPSARVAVSREEQDTRFADGVLRSEDRNANGGGAALTAGGPAELQGMGSGLMVLGGLGSRDMMAAVESRPAWTLLLTSEPPGAQRWADVILPTASRFETDCTYLASDGRVRRSLAALPRREEAPAVWRAAERVARAFGREAVPWSDHEASEAACALTGRAAGAPPEERE